MVEPEFRQVPRPLVQAEVQAPAREEEEGEGQEGQGGHQKGERGQKVKFTKSICQLKTVILLLDTRLKNSMKIWLLWTRKMVFPMQPNMLMTSKIFGFPEYGI